MNNNSIENLGVGDKVAIPSPWMCPWSILTIVGETPKRFVLNNGCKVWKETGLVVGDTTRARATVLTDEILAKVRGYRCMTWVKRKLPSMDIPDEKWVRIYKAVKEIINE